MEPWEWGVKDDHSFQIDRSPLINDNTKSGTKNFSDADREPCDSNEVIPVTQNQFGKKLYAYTIESSTTCSDNEGTEFDEDSCGKGCSNGIKEIVLCNSGTSLPNVNDTSSLKELDGDYNRKKSFNSICDNPSYHLHSHSRYTQKLNSKKRRSKSVYKLAKNRGKHKGLVTSYWAYKYWSPFLVIGLFVGLVTALVIAEVLIIHFAHKYVPNHAMDNDYYVSESARNYPSLMLWGEGVDGLTRLRNHEKNAELSAVGESFYNNFANYEDQHRSQGLAEKSADTGLKSFPVFVSLGRVPMLPPLNILIPKNELEGGETIEDKLSRQPLPQHQTSASGPEDDTFQRAKSFLLKSNHIPKQMPPSSSAFYESSAQLGLKIANLAPNSVRLKKEVGNGKLISNTKKDTVDRAQKIYLQGTGIRSPTYHDNLVLYEPHHPFDMLSLLPKGLRPSVYYNGLLLKQSVNEARFRLLILNHSQLLMDAIKLQLRNDPIMDNSLPKYLKRNFRLPGEITMRRFSPLLHKIDTLSAMDSSNQFMHHQKRGKDTLFNSAYMDIPQTNDKTLCPAIPPHIEGSLAKAHDKDHHSLPNPKMHSVALIPTSINHSHNGSATIMGRGTVMKTQRLHSPTSILPNFPLHTIPLLPYTFSFTGTQSWHQLQTLLPRVGNGGAWNPDGCIARHRLAIIIPYRDREEHLFRLLNSLHPFLQRQGISYKIYVVEQHGTESFNKAMLMNAAFREAFLEHRFHCFAFHDVDLIPENDRNFYTCPKQPRHLSVAIDEMGYKLIYQMLVGGVLMFRPEHFLSVNGYSNLYWGWGAEDDDMANRIQHSNLFITRPPEQIGRYRMIKHVKRTPMSLIKRYSLLSYGIQRIQIDGLNSNTYTIVKTIRYPLYTYFLIDIGKAPKGF